MGKKKQQKKQSAKGQAAVRHYLRCVQAAYEGSTDETAVRVLDGSDTTCNGTRLARLVWAALRNARVFEIDLPTYHALSYETGQYVWYKVAGLDPRRDPATTSKEEGQRVLDRLHAAASALPVFADTMPFDFVFFGIGSDGFELPAEVADTMLSMVPVDARSIRLIGHLVGPVYGTSDTDALSFVRVVTATGDDFIVPVLERASDKTGVGEWYHVTLLTPWLVNSILMFVHEHRTTVIENRPGLSVRMDYRQTAKRMGGLTMIPQPYYVVPLKDRVMRDVVRNVVRGFSKRGPLSYRHDRRGHERCRIQRGPLPLDPKKAAKLEERGYKVFTVNAPDANTQRQLIERRQAPKRTTEWLAVKTSWIDPCVVGNEELPYVPAVRVSEKSLAAKPRSG